MAWLRVLSVGRLGALLEWGRGDPIELPREEMAGRVMVGQFCLVMCVDGPRPYASMFLNDFIDDVASGLKTGDPVSLVVEEQTELGVNVVVNSRFWGLIYADDLFQRVRRGQALDGYVKLVREDGKLDITLNAPGYGSVDDLTDVVLERLKASEGFLPFNDQSEPEAIYAEFGVSKKRFKQALGALYKRRRISLVARGIKLNPGREGE